MMSELLNNRYSILQTLGRGGCGETFLAEDTHMPSRRRCVIKQLKPVVSNLAAYQIIKERFEREAAILEIIGRECDQIPKLQAYFMENREFYLVQDWVEGRNLEQMVAEEGLFSEPALREFLINILPVLDYIHERGIIHRDIKPANIMLRKEDCLPILIDFGAVKEIVTTMVDARGLSTFTIVIGSPGFMPPEQALGQPVFASDLYSLGLTAIFMLTGKSPTEWSQSPGRSWRASALHVSDNLAAILDKAIDPVAGNRYASAREMLEALRLRETIAGPPPPVYPVQSTQERAREDQTSRRLFVLIAALVLLLLAGVGVFGLYKYFEKKSAQAEQRAEREAQAKIEQERALRKEAEQKSREAEEKAKVAEETTAIEKAKREGKAYYVVQISNRTQLNIQYQVLNDDGTWYKAKIDPGKTNQHWRKSALVVKFDYTLSDGDKYEEKRYNLDSSAVIGEPAEAEKNSAPMYYFALKDTNTLDLYKLP